MQPSAPDTNGCKGWEIPIVKLSKIITDCKNIDGVLWHHLFDVLPCVIKGELIQNSQQYQFEVNGGSWLYIRSSDTTLIFGSFNRENEKYFLLAAYKE